MHPVYTGPPTDAQEVIRGFTVLGIDAIGFSVDALGQMTLMVPEEDAELARMFVSVVEDIEVAAARVRVRDAMAFRGGRDVGGAA